MNEIYIKLFVVPFLSDRAAPEPEFYKRSKEELEFLEKQGKIEAFNEGKNWEDETKWVRLLMQWISQEEEHRKIEISLNRFHEHYISAFTSLLIRGRVKAANSDYMILSVATCVSAVGFEWCFKDMYFNTAVKGTLENNSDEKNCYTMVIYNN